jgi:transcriptional regulator GlxA family with amidase domain
MDLCIELVRRDHGTSVAADLARRLVVPPHREGGQAQYVVTPLPNRPVDSLAPVLDWAQAHLDRPVSLIDLARAAGTSPRTLTRRFVDGMGVAPLRWLTGQRVRRAQELLESTDLSIEQIAERSGLGSAANLRVHFGRQVGTSPTAYRNTFAARSRDGATGFSRAGSL